MELWIRSQDKTTLIRSYEIYVSEQCNCYLIRAKRTSHILGSYKTFERALEVLDEIQNILKPIIKIKYEYDDSQPIMNGEWLKSLKEENKIEELSTYVYEMPKE